MPTITARILQSTGLAASTGSIAARELGLTSDTERPVIGSTVGGAKYIGTEEILNITTISPSAITVLKRSKTLIGVDTATAGGNVAIDIQNGAQVSGYRCKVFVFGVAGRKCQVTYGSGLFQDIPVERSQEFIWSGSAWIPTINEYDSSVSASINTLVLRDSSGRSQISNPAVDADIANRGWVRDFVYPVGSYYVQFPDASSNTDSVEFPTSQRPATLFGGTWVEQWSTESVYFRTRGTLSDSGRSSGKQEDAFQGHRHKTQVQTAQTSAASNTELGRGVAGSSVQTGDWARDEVTNGSEGTPRTASETRVVNRRIKVWKRTA